MPSQFVFVSFDIVGHGAEPDHGRQVDRVEKLNRIVDRVLTRMPSCIWASGGDGGHVAHPEAVEEDVVLSLVEELRSWSEQDDVRLRLSCHAGHADVIAGASSVRQLVGDGINQCGSLIHHGTPSSCIASDSFRRFAEERQWHRFRFHGPRTIYLKHFAVERAFLVDTPNHRSTSAARTRKDRELLRRAREKFSPQDPNPWTIVRLAKRLLQVSGTDEEARRALRSVAKGSYGALAFESRFSPGVRTHNPLFERLRPGDFERLVDEAELVERNDGEMFCAEGDKGDSLFVILQGEVGVVAPDRLRPEDESPAKPRDIRLGPGEVVGELAHVLGVPRTASLQAVGRTSVLSFKRAKTQQIGIEGLDMYETFEERVLEYLCNRAPYLKGRDDSGPLAEVDQPWKDLMHSARPITVRLAPAEVLSSGHEALSEDGLFVLVRGQMEQVRAGGPLRAPGGEEASERTLNGSELRVLFASIPGHLAHDFSEFRAVEGQEIELIRLDHRVFLETFRAQFSGFLEAIRRELESLVLCDVFLSYAGDDRAEAERWADALAAEGLSVYMNEPQGGTRFIGELRQLLTGSRVIAPLITQGVVNEHKVRSDSPSWVKREIDYRLAVFPDGNVLPIGVDGAATEVVAGGITPVPVTSGADKSSVERVASNIRKLIDANRLPTAREPLSWQKNLGILERT